MSRRRNSCRRGTAILTADRYAKELLASRTGCVDRTPGTKCSVLYLNNTIRTGIWNEQHKCIVPNVDNHRQTFCPESNLYNIYQDPRSKSNPCEYYDKPTCTEEDNSPYVVYNPYRVIKDYDDKVYEKLCVDRIPGTQCFHVVQHKKTKRMRVFPGTYADNGECQVPKKDKSYTWKSPCDYGGKWNKKTKRCDYDVLHPSC